MSDTAPDRPAFEAALRGVAAAMADDAALTERRAERVNVAVVASPAVTTRGHLRLVVSA